jgi:hypothetical protein
MAIIQCAWVALGKSDEIAKEEAEDCVDLAESIRERIHELTRAAECERALMHQPRPFEYKVVPRGEACSLEASLNGYGADGWQLVGDHREGWLILMRPRKAGV